MMVHKRFALLAALNAGAQGPPTTGADVFQRMHDAYGGKWYHTLTFRQKTTAYRNGQPNVSQWYESLRHTPEHGTQLRIDMSKVSSGTYDGRPVWVVGALSPTDTTSPQFWVDKERNVVVRMIMGVAGRPMDVHLDKYEKAGNGWLATKVEMYQGGAPLQIEEYSDWKTGIALSPALFDPTTWSTAPHWAK